MLLLRLKQEFLAALETESGRSIKTIENYNRYLSRCLAFTKAKHPYELTEEKIRQFRHYLSQQAVPNANGKKVLLKQRTQNYYLIALRSFLNFLRARGISAIHPELIVLDKAPEQTPDLISPADLVKLLTYPPLTTLEGKRDRAILELLISTGLRVSELCSLQIKDIDLASNKFKFKGKGEIVRLVFLTDSTRNALKSYLAARKDKEDSLFIRYGKKAQVGVEARISPRTVQRLLKHYATKVGIAGKVSPQVIRHSFANELLKSGTDANLVQVRLGNISRSTYKF